MKEALQTPTQKPCSKTRNGVNKETIKKVHERGDKVVVNGAKESLLAILRKFICKCTKHTLEKLTTKFLNQNRITASYDLLVWMFIFIRRNVEHEIYIEILKQYLSKMNKKRDEQENHQSEEYIQKKKKTISKFIESGQKLMTDYLNIRTIQKSVETLYSKGKSKENAFQKIKTYLQKQQLSDNLEFEQGNCSFKRQNLVGPPQQEIIEETQNFNNSSDNFEEGISYNPPVQGTQNQVQDQANISIKNQRYPSFDLFEELIQQSSASLFSEYLSFGLQHSQY